MNLPEMLAYKGFAWHCYISLVGNPAFRGIVRHFPGEGLWDPQVAFSGEDKLDMRFYSVKKSQKSIDARSDHGRRSRAISRPQQPRDTKVTAKR